MNQTHGGIQSIFFRNRHLLVLSIVVSIAAGLFAVSSLQRLEDPRITNLYPIVITSYPGASAAVIESRITQILESEVSGIEGVKSITSKSLDDMSSISVEFNLERDIDGAANDVRDRVGRAAWRLPDDLKHFKRTTTPQSD